MHVYVKIKDEGREEVFPNLEIIVKMYTNVYFKRTDERSILIFIYLTSIQVKPLFKIIKKDCEYEI